MTEENSDYKSEAFDPFSNISLEIPIGENINIYDCFDNYTKSESIDFKQNEDDTKKYNKKILIWRFPKHLIIVFKRFDNDGNKINSLIDYPIENLNLNKYCVGYDKKESIYDLYAVSNHSGGTV